MSKNKPKRVKVRTFRNKVILTNNVDKVLAWSTDRRYCFLGSRETWGYRTGKIYPKKLKSETVIK